MTAAAAQTLVTYQQECQQSVAEFRASWFAKGMGRQDARHRARTSTSHQYLPGCAERTLSRIKACVTNTKQGDVSSAASAIRVNCTLLCTLLVQLLSAVCLFLRATVVAAPRARTHLTAPPAHLLTGSLLKSSPRNSALRLVAIRYRQ